MAYNLTPFTTLKVKIKVHVVSDNVGYMFENIIAKANKYYQYVLGKTSRMLHHKD